MNVSSAKITAKLAATITKAIGALDASASTTMTIEEDDASFTHGTSDDQADIVWAGSGSIAASGDVDIDLAGVLTDAFGDTITMAKVVAIFVRNDSDDQDPATTAEIRVGGGDGGDGTNAFDTWVLSAAGAGAGDGSEAVRVQSGGFILLAAPKTGYVVTAATADILRILNADGVNAAHYEIVIVARTA